VIRLRPGPEAASEFLDWKSLERGASEFLLTYPPRRRLEDRVLDVVRCAQAVCSLESVDCTRLVFGEPDEIHPPDELVIVALLREKGWIPAG
jgi:hypothetical protein